MGKRYRNLYPAIADIESLRAGYKRAQEGKRSSNGFLVFQEHAEANLLDIHNRLVDETWEPEPYRRFLIYEPKQRLIGAPSFADRVVHHSLCATIEPIMDKTFLPWTFACRYGKGTHAGVVYVQSQLRKHGYTHFLKTDFRSYFPSIDRALLHREYERKIACAATLDLLRKIIPPTGTGVPIGALTSQLSANVYGNIMDQYLHHELRVPFARYMDDIIVMGNDPDHLRKVKRNLEAFAQASMKLEISRWQVSPVSRGVNFLGYRIWPTHKLLRKSSVTAAKRKVRRFVARDERENLARFVGSWKGHASKADTHNLLIWLEHNYDVARHVGMHKKAPRPSRQALLETMFD